MENEMSTNNFAKAILKLLKRLNKVNLDEALHRGCKPFYVENKQVGLIRPDFLTHLKHYTEELQIVEEDSYANKNGNKPGVHLSSKYHSYKEKTEAMNRLLENLREKDVILALRGWRNENYKVAQMYTEKALLEVERSCCGLFGFIQYGVHVNGFTKDDNGEIKIWIGKRSKTKQTFPDMYDNMCAGGLAADLGVLECVKKECKEEASVSDEVLEGLKFVGNVSYFYEDERGLFPECQFIYDLQVPIDFTPVNADGEVADFHLYSVDEVKQLIIGDNFKPNCAAICLEFLIRHGFINPDTDPYVSYYVEQLHAPLQSYYAGK
ncbi:uncharacterized protein LOC131958427 [Physella acuta]|uniref:uncharacterized protein LOC131958427 n=1 Tax=Physella acuta TaxID=109671 RepID=UPI0027DB7A2C|nr:uncharacterized protein LOC131958427 [Physella acuta]